MATNKTHHSCPISGCKVVVRNGLLMCPHHWHMVPKKLKSDVYFFYRSGHTNGYAEAKAKAIAVVEGAERAVQEVQTQPL